MVEILLRLGASAGVTEFGPTELGPAEFGLIAGCPPGMVAAPFNHVLPLSAI
jgi:hypothetical protein